MKVAKFLRNLSTSPISGLVILILFTNMNTHLAGELRTCHGQFIAIVESSNNTENTNTMSVPFLQLGFLPVRKRKLCKSSRRYLCMHEDKFNFSLIPSEIMILHMIYYFPR